jgi:NAD(P)-dependent dehydrogenase (short-subunit alcohol dehydrogenase family)
MLLDNKSAVIYGGGGSIGGAMAPAFAREGAKVFLAGRSRAALEQVAEAIRATGGAAETARRSTHSTSRRSTGMQTRSRRSPEASTSPST